MLKIKRFLTAGTCLFALAISLPIIHLAQESKMGKAQLKGTILNEKNELISNVKLQLKHENIGEIFQSMSDEQGTFEFPVVSPGKYILVVEKDGYMSYSTEVDLKPNLVQTIEITLADEETLDQKRKQEALKSFQTGADLAREGKINLAIRAFQKAVELKSDLAEAHLNLGILFLREQKLDESEKALLEYVKLKPEEPKGKTILCDINFEQAKVLMQEMMMDEALKELEQAHNYRQDHALVNYLMGYLYFRKEMTEKAVKHLEAFIQLAPELPQVETANKILKTIRGKN